MKRSAVKAKPVAYRVAESLKLPDKQTELHHKPSEDIFRRNTIGKSPPLKKTGIDLNTDLVIFSKCKPEALIIIDISWNS